MSWLEEKQSAWLYRRAAQAETDTRVRQLFINLAEAAERQAVVWDGSQQVAFKPAMRAQIVAVLLRYISPRKLRPVLAAMKLRGLSVYDAPSHRLPNGGHIMPTSLSDVGKSHRVYGGGNLRAAVFGVNDGLISNTCLIMGVTGATASANVGSQYIVTSGVAGLLAGALSMAAGEYVSMRSQREMYEYQIGLERAELTEYPAEEAEELALIYEARGLELNRAREFVKDLMRDPHHALDVLSREELGLNPDDLGSPWGAATFSFIAFAIGAAVPLLPFLLHMDAAKSLWWSCGGTAVALFVVGLSLSLFTGRGALRGALRMLLIGGGAGVMTYLIGQWLGTALV